MSCGRCLGDHDGRCSSASNEAIKRLVVVRTSQRLYRGILGAITRGEFESMDDAANATDDELLRLRNFGQTTLAEFRVRFPPTAPRGYARPVRHTRPLLEALRRIDEECSV